MHYLSIIFVILSISVLSAQNDTTIYRLTGTSVMEFSVGVDTLVQKEDLLNKAMINALQTKFGYNLFAISQVNAQNDGNTTTDKFTEYSELSTRGEWLSTENEPVFEFLHEKKAKKKYEKPIISLKCTVSGFGKLTNSSPIEFDVKPQNCPKFECCTTTFKHGDRFYLWFKGNTDGYISVYLAMPKEDWVQCLLPNGEVKANQAFFLFHPSKYNYAVSLSNIQNNLEYNFVYVLFSKENPNLPLSIKDNKHAIIDQDKGVRLPDALSYTKFSAWLNLNTNVSNCQYKRIKISIQK